MKQRLYFSVLMDIKKYSKILTFPISRNLPIYRYEVARLLIGLTSECSTLILNYFHKNLTCVEVFCCLFLMVSYISSFCLFGLDKKQENGYQILQPSNLSGEHHW